MIGRLRGLACAIVIVASPFLIAGEIAPQRRLTEIPNPDATLQLASFKAAEGFEINLFAAEPAISKPIHMNFDAAGRLWVVGSDLYPQIQPGGHRVDKVYILEDTDGDGRSDSSTVFADNLLIPTGIVPDDTAPHLAAYVANSSEIVYLEDTNGDRIADKSRVVLSGFGTEDSHHLVHSFRWGPGGHLFFAQSIYIHSHVETPWGVRRLLGGGIWRFQPDMMKLDVYTRGGINMWGHHFDRYGQSFLTDGAGAHGINYAFPGATYETAVGAERLLKGLNPGQPKHAGLEVISGRHLPERWRGRLITSDFRGNRVNSFELQQSGSGYISKQTEDLVVSTHGAFRPVDVKMGPDGAIYIADWYNPIIQHGEVDFRDARRDRAHGRIWRITASGRPLVARRKLADATVQQLLDALAEPEQFTREMVRPLLKRRGAAAALPALDAWVGRLDASDPVQAPLVLEALWVREWLNAPDTGLLERALRSADSRVRAGAVRVAANWADRLPNSTALFARAVNDPHPQVRLEAVNALRLAGTAEAARTAVLAADHPLDANLDFALWLTMRELSGAWVPRLVADARFFGDDPRRLLIAVESAGRSDALAPVLSLWRSGAIPRELHARALQLFGDIGGPAEVRLLFDLALGADVASSDRVGMLDALRHAASDRTLRPTGDLVPIVGLLDSADLDVRSAALQLAGAWRLEAARAAAVLAAAAEAPAVRAAALQALVDLGGSSRATLVERAASGPAPRRAEAIAALTRLDVAAAAPIAVDLLSSAAGVDTAALAAPFLRQKEGPAALAAALAGRSIPPAAGRALLQAISTSGLALPALASVVESAARLERLAAMPTGPALAAMIRAVEADGDAARGERIYRRQQILCMSCHAIAGAGGQVGPDLTSIGASAPVDYLLESLLDPQARVKEGYQVVTVTRTNGSVVAGMLARDGGQELSIRDGGGNLITIPTSQIASRQMSSSSLMPPGLTVQLRRDELVDLVKFLSLLGRTGGVAVPNEPVVRRWRILEADGAISTRLREQGLGYAARPESALPWRAAYSTVAGDLPLSDVPVVAYFGDQRFRVAAFDVEVQQPGTQALRVSAARGLWIWLDGQPVEVGGDTVSIALTAGRHVITVAVENTIYPGDTLRIALAPGATAQVQVVSGQ